MNMETENAESTLQELTGFPVAVRPVTLEFNLATTTTNGQQPSLIVQPSPVQDVISILERHLAKGDTENPPQGDDDDDDSKRESSLQDLPTCRRTNAEDDAVEDWMQENEELLERSDGAVKIEDESTLIKCVMVNKSGIPDYSRMMKLDTNIIREVLNKHGIEMKDVASNDAGEELALLRKKKKKKKKKSKMEEEDGAEDSEKTKKEKILIKCTLCDKTFANRKYLRDHRRYHNGRKYKCRHCTYEAVRPRELEYHLNSHTGSKPFACDICQKGFGHPAVLASHKKTHRGHTGAVTCTICKAQFAQPAMLDRHMISHDENRPHVCAYCPDDFKRHMDLRNHIRIHHKEVPVDVVAPRQQPVTSGDFHCDQCKRSFATNKGLEQHQRRTHNSRQVMEWTDQEDMKITCDQCSKVFDCLKAFNKHKVSHSSLRPYTCSVCGRSYKRQWELHKHKLTHDGKALIPCTLCNVEFVGMMNLRRHMRRMHQEGVKKPVPKNFVCDVCNHAYSRQVELEEHKNIHTGARPYVCDSCGKTFSFRSSLACHRKLHQDEGAIHCDLCGKRFGSKIRMKEHRVIHTGEKNYECPSCGIKYRYPSNLRWHLSNSNKNSCGKGLKSSSTKVKRRTKASSVQEQVQPLEPGEIPTSQQPPQQVIQLAELQPLSQSMSVLLPAAGGDSSLTENGAETAQFQSLLGKPSATLVEGHQEGLLTVTEIVLPVW